MEGVIFLMPVPLGSTARGVIPYCGDVGSQAADQRGSLVLPVCGKVVGRWREGIRNVCRKVWEVWMGCKDR